MMTQRFAWVLCAAVSFACAGCYRPDAEHGAALFRKDCAGCHIPRPGQTTYVPSLAGYFDRRSRPNERKTRRTILEGGRYMPPFRMRLSSHDIDDVIAYLKTNP
ncbi:MAG: cytochrome c [Silvibacterium sp.]|nr:cytochrome c [Silvibacterium sp.]